MRLQLVVALAVPLYAEPTFRLLKGEITEWTVRGLVGEMAIRQRDNHVFRCQVVTETYITRETMRVTPVGVKPGDHAEIITDWREGSSRCIALTIYLRGPEVPFRQGTSELTRAPAATTSRPIFDGLLARGNLAFSGIVQLVEQNRLTLWTREYGVKAFALRPDTVFSDQGRKVDSKTLIPQTRVYVRAGRSYEGDLEAYQVVWGEIRTPNR